MGLRDLGYAAVAMFCGTSALAAELNIDKHSPICSDERGAPFCSIQAAVEFASPDSILNIAPGDYFETPRLTKSLILKGSEGVTIDAEYQDSVIKVRPGVVVNLQGLHIINGLAENGGGIDNQGDLTLQHCIIENNIALGSGGGIYSAGSMSSSLKLVQTQVRSNYAVGDDEFNVKFGGGGIYSDSPLSIVESTISDNVALENGGGVYSSYTYRRQITPLEKLTEDMGIASKPNKHTTIKTKLEQGSVTISKSVVSNNIASNGGGVYVIGGMELRKTHIKDNSADRIRFSSGGGIFAHFNAGIHLVNSIVSHNFARFRGGGLRFYSAHAANIYSSSLLDNRVNRNGWGGGIFVQTGSSSLTMSHSLLSDNLAGEDVASDCYGKLESAGFNFIQQGAKCGFVASESDIVSTFDNHFSAGVVLGDDAMYHLSKDSVLIDAGSDKGCSGPEGIPLATDINSHARIMDGNGDGVKRCDIGAVEFGPL